MIHTKITSIKVLFASVVLFLLCVSPALAHVVVKPSSAGVAAFQTFTVGVPNEKDNPTVGVRLLIPEGLQHISPNVKPGWTIEVNSTSEGMKGDVLNTGEKAPRKVTEIVWTGGSIPAGQRDDFLFSAQVPAETTTIAWKAYQTYQDGSVVAWDQDPEDMKNLSDEEKEKREEENKGPYSQTAIVNDLIATNQTLSGSTQEITIPLLLSILAVVLSGISVWMQVRKK